MREREARVPVADALGAGDRLERVLGGAGEDEGRGRQPTHRLADDVVALLKTAELGLPMQAAGLDAARRGLEDLGAGLEGVGVVADPERGAGVAAMQPPCEPMTRMRPASPEVSMPTESRAQTSGGPSLSRQRPSA